MADLNKELSKELSKDFAYCEDALGRAENAIGNLPSAQPEITRCKDCKNWDTTWTNDFSPNYHYCPMVDGVRKEDWYCADAERRADE